MVKFRPRTEPSPSPSPSPEPEVDDEDTIAVYRSPTPTPQQDIVMTAEVDETQVRSTADDTTKNLFSTEHKNTNPYETFHHVGGGQWARGKRPAHLLNNAIRLGKQKKADPHKLLDGLPALDQVVSTPQGPDVWPGVTWYNHGDGLWGRQMPARLVQQQEGVQSTSAADIAESEVVTSEDIPSTVLKGESAVKKAGSAAKEDGKDDDTANFSIVAVTTGGEALVVNTVSIARYSLAPWFNSWVRSAEITNKDLWREWQSKADELEAASTAGTMEEFRKKWILYHNEDTVWMVPNKGAVHVDQMIFATQQHSHSIANNKHGIIIGERYESQEYLAAVIDGNGLIQLKSLHISKNIKECFIREWEATTEAVTRSVKDSLDKSSASHIVCRSSKVLLVVDKTQIGDLLEQVLSILRGKSTIEQEIVKGGAYNQAVTLQ